MTSPGLSREQRIKTTCAELGLVGSDEDTGLAEIRAEDEIPLYLLVERNLGGAADEQSHYLTAHATLDAAAAYHLANEYPADWSIEFAVDLDNGWKYTSEVIHKVQWAFVPPPAAYAPHGDPEFEPVDPK